MKNRTAHLAASAVLGLAVGALSGSGRALAQDNAGPAEAATPAGGAAPATTPPPAAASVTVPMSATEATLRQGTIRVDGDLVIGLSKGSAWKPIQIVPNLYYGVSNELTAGFANNTNAEIFQAVSAPGGRGLCLSGSSDGCAHVYNSFSLDALYSFMRSSRVDVAAHGGVDFLLDPFLLSLRLGLKGKAGLGPLAIVFDPSLNIGLNRRDRNEDVLQVPLRVGVMATSQLNVGVSVALNGQLDGFGNSYMVPLGAGATFALNGAVDVRAQFAFDNLAGKNASADLRTVSVGAAYHM
jgi:hypothetical protein